MRQIFELMIYFANVGPGSDLVKVGYAADDHVHVLMHVDFGAGEETRDGVLLELRYQGTTIARSESKRLAAR